MIVNPLLLPIASRKYIEDIFESISRRMMLKNTNIISNEIDRFSLVIKNGLYNNLPITLIVLIESEIGIPDIIKILNIEYEDFVTKITTAHSKGLPLQSISINVQEKKHDLAKYNISSISIYNDDGLTIHYSVQYPYYTIKNNNPKTLKVILPTKPIIIE